MVQVERGEDMTKDFREQAEHEQLAGTVDDGGQNNKTIFGIRPQEPSEEHGALGWTAALQDMSDTWGRKLLTPAERTEGKAFRKEEAEKAITKYRMAQDAFSANRSV